MANYNKSFSFRNGVQVDEDNFFVNANGLVGIGTTIPKSTLDVYGDISVSGLSTMKQMIISGIASFVDLRVGSYITMTDSGIITALRYYGDGSYLDGIPTNQWTDYTGSGITSSYILRNRIGIATNIPTASLQIGGRTEDGQIGVGINSSGNIKASGIITAGYFSGNGSDITNINATNISSGTLNNSSLPNNINLPTGIATVGTITATNAYIGVSTFNSNGLFSKNITGSSFTGGNFYASKNIEIYASNLIFSGGSGVSIAGSTGNAGQFLVSNGSSGINWSSDISIIGVVTVGVLTSRDIFNSGFTTTTNLKVTNIGIVTYLSALKSSVYESELTRVNSGILTASYINSSYSNLGILTASSVQTTNINASGVGTFLSITAGAITINDAISKIEATFGDLSLGASNNNVIITDGFEVFGNTSLTGIATVSTGLVPNSDKTAYLGSSTKSFSEAHIDEVQIGVSGATGIVSTRSGDLSLDSNTGTVSVSKDLSVSRGLSVTGISTISTLVSTVSIVPNTDGGSFLGTTGTPFANAHVADVNIGSGGVGVISTRSGNLSLDSQSGKVNINRDLDIGRNLNVSGISTIDNLYTDYSIVNVNISPDFDKGSSIGYAGTAFENAYINEVTIGIAGTNSIGTRNSNTLELTSSSGIVTVTNSLYVKGHLESNNLNLIGIATVGTAILPNVNFSGSIGNASYAFGSAYINKIRLGSSGSGNIIDTTTGELILKTDSNLVRVSDQLVIDNELYSGSLYADSNQVSIGTTNASNLSPNSNLLVYDDNISQIDLYSNSANGESAIKFVTNGGIEGRLGFSTIGDFTLQSKDPRGNIKFILNNSEFNGISSGNFYWDNGYWETNLATLTWDGKFGLNNNEPESTLDVVGTSSITGNSYFGNNVIISGNLSVDGIVSSLLGINVTNDNLPNIITKNINVTSGVSTFNTIKPNTIGIGTTGLLLDLVDIDAKDSKALFQSIGIGTTGITKNIYSDVGLLISGKMIVESASSSYIGIGTSTKFYPNGDPEFNTPSGLEGDIQIFEYGVDLYRTYVNIFKDSSVGFNTDLPRGVLDFGYADDTADFYPVVILPNINDTARNGIGDTATGAVIFNTSLNKFQGWTGTTWVDFH